MLGTGLLCLRWPLLTFSTYGTHLPGFRDFHDRIWAGDVSLATDEAKLRYARVHMNQFLQNMRAVRFQDALRIVLRPACQRLTGRSPSLLRWSFATGPRPGVSICT